MRTFVKIALLVALWLVLGAGAIRLDGCAGGQAPSGLAQITLARARLTVGTFQHRPNRFYYRLQLAAIGSGA